MEHQTDGSWLLFAATEEEIGGNRPFPFTVIDWASRKLTAVCRSSLSAEVQTLVAVDNLEWAKILFGFMIWLSCRPDQAEVMRWLGDSPCIADVCAFYDASNSKAPGMKFQEKRIAIELKISWWCFLVVQLASAAG